MIGRHGRTFRASMTIKLSETILLSQTQFVLGMPLRKKLATHCSSKLIKSEQSQNLSKPLLNHMLQVGVSWSLIVPVRRKILLSLISSLEFALVKSRLGRLVAGMYPVEENADNSERLAKYNQLLRIEAELGDKAIYA